MIRSASMVPATILQSTSLIRGKTQCWPCQYQHPYSSIHFPHPREDGWAGFNRKRRDSSIHFPHPREDPADRKEIEGMGDLQSTSLIRGKTSNFHFCSVRLFLQSTSLIRGKTALQRQPTCTTSIFNPLPSSEGRQQNFLILFSNPNIFLVHLYNFIFYLSNSQKKSRNSAIKP